MSKSKFNQTYTEEDCLGSLREAERRLGHSPSQTEYRSLGLSPSTATIKQKCGGWNVAKEKAGQVTQQFDKTKQVNADYFRAIDGPEKAYWLGFIYGDGFLIDSSDVYGFGMELSESDAHHLERFRDAIDSEHSIQRRDYEDRTPTVRLTVYHKEFADHLKNHGIDADKTFSGSLPTLREEFKNSFVRGLFDADGHYCAIPRNKEWCIVGSKPRLSVVETWLPVPGKVTKDRLRVNREAARRELFEWLYPDGEDTSPKLKRKYIHAATDLF